jgi:hypothetical protein
MSTATQDLYSREMTRIIEAQTALNRRIAKLESAIRYGHEIPETPPPLDIHKLAEAICMSPRV